MSTDGLTDARLSYLERQNRHLKHWLMGVTATLAIIGLLGGRSVATPAAAAGKPAVGVTSIDKLHVHELIVEDAQGNNVIALLAKGDRLKEGGGSIHLLANGTELELSVDRNKASIRGACDRGHSEFWTAVGESTAITRIKHGNDDVISVCDQGVPRVHLMSGDDHLQTMLTARESQVGIMPGPAPQK